MHVSDWIVSEVHPHNRMYETIPRGSFDTPDAAFSRASLVCNRLDCPKSYVTVQCILSPENHPFL